MRIIGIIPARYASTRFPGKPLVIIEGKTMIQRVYEQAMKADALSAVVVATDDHRIMEAVQAFGGRVVMTSVNHLSGTDRCLEAFEKQTDHFDAVVNIQGDEPFIDPAHINKVAKLLQPNYPIASLCTPITNQLEIFDPNTVKVVLNKQSKALYFSRSPIPHYRGLPEQEWLLKTTFLRHIGIYAFLAESLKTITQLPVSELERAESLEQLRWIENGYPIAMGITDASPIGIDTPEDVDKLRNFFGKTAY